MQVAVASPFQGWAWFRESVNTRGSLRADNERLGQALRLAQFQLQRYEALEAENNRLRALRENTSGLGPRFIIGQIVHVDLDAFRARILVDKGSREGVFIGQAVVDLGGVFGQVTRVGQLTSEVILISDPTHAIPVQINRNGLRTIAVGSGEASHLKLPYLPTSADVMKGDLLVTSGLGGRFPAGYPVGTVAEVKRDPTQSLAEVEVTPAAALDRARELLFVWPSAAEAGAKDEAADMLADVAKPAAQVAPAPKPASAPKAEHSAPAKPESRAESAAKPVPAKPISKVELAAKPASVPKPVPAAKPAPAPRKPQTQQTDPAKGAKPR
jgi:rod shape-determining protein MreC